MDRKSKQKIGYIFWALAAVIIIMMLFFCSINRANHIRDEQMQELVIIYPEIETELQENFSYYKDQLVDLELAVMAAVFFLVLVLGSGFVWYEKHEQKRHMIKDDHKIDFIQEQVSRFLKGNFELIPSPEEISTTDKWGSLYEKLCELGYYFSELKVRLAKEENSTKALITDISHQLKTPLASIRMCHELAKSPELSEEEQKDFLAKEAQEILKMEELLDELMKLSRLESNMIQVKPEKNSLKQTISEAVSRIFMKAYEKNIEIAVDMEEDAEIFHDKKWTGEAFANILENAVKYSEEKTSINIRTSYLPNSVLIEIEDEGMGIREEELHEIFKRFYRGQEAKKQVKEGAGVGLYLARNILEQQGGTIFAKRKPDKGTIFKIMLPTTYNQLSIT